MAETVIPGTVTFACDICGENLGSTPSTNLRGLKREASYGLDLCPAHTTELEAWVETQKAQLQNP